MNVIELSSDIGIKQPLQNFIVGVIFANLLQVSMNNGKLRRVSITLNLKISARHLFENNFLSIQQTQKSFSIISTGIFNFAAAVSKTIFRSRTEAFAILFIFRAPSLSVC
jgi:hypothetical protein